MYASIKILECWQLSLPSFTALNYFSIHTDLVVPFSLFTFDFTFECCGVVVKLSNLQCSVFFQLLGQGRKVLYSTEICTQCKTGNDSTEMLHVKYFTRVT